MLRLVSVDARYETYINAVRGDKPDTVCASLWWDTTSGAGWRVGFRLPGLKKRSARAFADKTAAIDYAAAIVAIWFTKCMKDDMTTVNIDGREVKL